MKARHFIRLLWQIPGKLTNKYVVALLFFVTWMTFFDKHNFITQFELNAAIQKLEAERDFYAEQIGLLKEEQDLIQNERERYAREKYFMHRADEEIYIVREK
jgi:cell division protein FtsB